MFNCSFFSFIAQSDEAKILKNKKVGDLFMVKENSPVITVDGPSGAGKGTLTSLLTECLNWNFLDSGALYRVIAIAAEKRQISFDNVAELVRIGENLNVRFETAKDNTLIYLDDENVTDQVRLETTGNMASKIAPLTEVRNALLHRQKQFRCAPGLVADGRDMGTVVFPDADLKLYLTASPEERAKRRYLQLKEKGLDVSIARLADEIKERDERDMNREVAPLKPATDAILLDSSSMSIEEVFEKAMVYVRQEQLF